jgi:hypothetical protein
LFITIVSCNKESSCDCLKKTGAIAKESREIIGGFNRIVISQNINLILTQDTVNSIEIEAGENLIPLINARIDGKSLLLTNDNTCNWLRSNKPKVNVYVHVAKINFIEMRGCGDVITTNTIKTDTLYVDQMDASGKADLTVDVQQTYLRLHTGPGDINIVGKTDGNYIYSNGNGFVHSENLVNNYTFVNCFGTGDCYVTATNALDANITYIGSVFYYGNPISISVNNIGTGVFEKK